MRHDKHSLNRKESVNKAVSLSVSTSMWDLGSTHCRWRWSLMIIYLQNLASQRSYLSWSHLPCKCKSNCTYPSTTWGWSWCILGATLWDDFQRKIKSNGGGSLLIWRAQVGNCYDPPTLVNTAQFWKGSEIIYKKALETVLLRMAHWP